MSKTRTPLYWQGQRVGFIHDVKVDMYHLYGKWEPAATDHAENFCQSLTMGNEEEATLGEGEGACPVRAGAIEDGLIDVLRVVEPVPSVSVRNWLQRLLSRGDQSP